MVILVSRPPCVLLMESSVCDRFIVRLTVGPVTAIVMPSLSSVMVKRSSVPAVGGFVKTEPSPFRTSVFPLVPASVISCKFVFARNAAST